MFKLFYNFDFFSVLVNCFFFRLCKQMNVLKITAYFAFQMHAHITYYPVISAITVCIVNRVMNKWGFRPPLWIYRLTMPGETLRIVRCIRRLRPPDTGFEIRALAV